MPPTHPRGHEYFREGSVIAVNQRGGTVQGEVEGSQYEPYRVRLTFDAGGLAQAVCDCPYDWGGWCKHIVAVLLTCMYDQEIIAQKQPLAETLAGLTKEQLTALLLKLTAQEPALADRLDAHLAVVLAESEADAALPDAPKRTSRKTALKPETFYRQMYAILHSLDGMRGSEAYWHVSGVVDQAQKILDQAWDYIQAGDGASALAILDGATSAYVDEWEILDGSDGSTGDFFDELGPIWAEALLTAELAPHEHQAWQTKLAEWEREVSDYGIDDAFGCPITAAKQGCDYHPLQRVLQGEITNKGTWEGDTPWYANELALVRLNILARQKRYQEYIHLAEAEGQTGLHLAMLVRVGRSAEAVAEGKKRLAAADEALTLAKALREHKQLDAAMQIAEHGLALPGNTQHLASWLRDVAEASGDPTRALPAAVTAFKAMPELNAYQRVQSLAGGEWPTIKENLLTALAAHNYPPRKIDIYLHENMHQEAVQAASSGYLGYDALRRVANAVMKTHPDWTIKQCKRHAEQIMDAGKSKYYHHAANWLELARKTYVAAGRLDEWREYLGGLMAKHMRKYSLMPKLKNLI